jgi:hypothetical protein
MRMAGQNLEVIERAITYLEHERRGERGEHEIAYKDERC